MKGVSHRNENCHIESRRQMYTKPIRIPVSVILLVSSLKQLPKQHLMRAEAVSESLYTMILQGPSRARRARFPCARGKGGVGVPPTSSPPLPPHGHEYAYMRPYSPNLGTNETYRDRGVALPGVEFTAGGSNVYKHALSPSSILAHFLLL